jgi:hypothetical protein
MPRNPQRSPESACQFAQADFANLQRRFESLLVAGFAWLDVSRLDGIA